MSNLDDVVRRLDAIERVLRVIVKLLTDDEDQPEAVGIGVTGKPRDEGQSLG